MDPIAKQILNNLKCPQCGGQIDLFEWKSIYKGLHPDHQYNFSCVANWEHYRLFFNHWDPPFNDIEYQTVTVYDGKRMYNITQHNKSQLTNVQIFHVDAENRIIEEPIIKGFQYDKWLFDFTNTTPEKIINRVRTIMVFQ